MRRFIQAILLVALASVARVDAQVIDTFFLNAQSSAITDCSAAKCAIFNVNGVPSIGIQLVGTASATGTFEKTADGNTWVTATATAADGTTATTATAAGYFSLVNDGIQAVRVRITTYASGGFMVTGVAGRAMARIFTPNFTRGLFGDGACGSTPSIAFTAEPSTGIYRSGAGTIVVCNAGAQGASFTSTQVNIPPAGFFRNSGNGTSISMPADGVIALNDNGATDGLRFQFNAVPTIGSGFGTSPSVVTNSTDTVGQVNVGTGGVATSGVINFNATWAIAPFCLVQDATNNVATRVTATTTTTMTITAAAAWTASDIVTWICIGHK